MKNNIKNKIESDETYWKKYDDNNDLSFHNHDLDMDVLVKFRSLNGDVIYEIKERRLNCNLRDLKLWFERLKKTIKMLDEAETKKEDDEGF